jgi:hypothetical protein
VGFGVVGVGFGVVGVGIGVVGVGVGVTVGLIVFVGPGDGEALAEADGEADGDMPCSSPCQLPNVHGTTAKLGCGRNLRAAAKNLAHMGAQYVPPNVDPMGKRLSMLPIHTAAANCGVYPEYQTSQLSSAVPVLPARG